MIVIANNNLNTNLDFGARITIPKKSSKPPFVDFAFKYFGSKPEPPVITPEEMQKLNLAEIEYIKSLNVHKGPLNPSDLPQKMLEPTTPVSLSQEMLEIAERLDAHLTQKATIAKEVFGECIKTEADEVYANVVPSSETSPGFAKKISDTYEYMVNGSTAEMNIETGRLDDIVNSDEATIFVANHDNPPYDASLSMFFYSQLYKRADELGQSSTIPKPVLITDKRIYNGFPDKLRESLTKVGITPVVATSYPSLKSAKENKPILDSVIKGFANDSNHILIYPEGRRNKFREQLPLTERFQSGIGKIIQDSLQNKKRVKVVSLGVSYENGVGSIHIGQPLYFTKDASKNGIKVSGGNISSDTQSYKDNSFYRRMAQTSEGNGIEICYNGTPIKITDKQFMPRLIAGILCADLDVCANKALTAI